jgi:membrane fusion protein (multidrug efflux system)
MKQIIVVILIGLVALIASSCAQSMAKDNEEAEKQQHQAESNPVETIILQNTTFNKELISNGKLKAHKKCELQFELSGQLAGVYAKNGAKVGANSVIAILNQIEAKQKLKQAEIQFQKAELDRQELLISQGYETAQIDSIPKKILETANIRSGYSSAKNSLEEAKINLSKHSLVAPLSGIVANLNSKVYEYPKTGEPFCTIIDDSKFEVEFNVLENELKEIKLGSKVTVQPFSLEKDFKGHISEINPFIDENGMVKIKAMITNTGGLIEGMNVKIMIQKTIIDQLVVPKSAVLLRQNKEVLFTVKSDKAYWTYVHTTNENSTHYTVIANTDRGAELNAGDTVIVSGNLNLAHESNVVHSRQSTVGSQ